MANMSKNEAFIKIAAILSALLETNGSPESMLYIFCDMDMDNWQMLRHILIETNLVDIKGNYVTLTEDGRIKAEKLNALVSR